MFRILLVDDEAEERDGIHYLIQRYQLPLKVAMAHNGQEALAYLKSHQVDILFTDVKMPFMDGLTLAGLTYGWNPEIRIIIFSAYGEFEYAKKAMEAHAVDYLLKPIELEEFEKVMKKVIGELESQRVQDDYDRELREVDKKRLLYKGCTGGNLSEFEYKQIGSLLQSLENRHKVLVSLETGSNLFEQQEQVFLKLLDTYLPASYEYVNLYPDTSYLMYYGELHLPDTGLKEALLKVKRDVRMVMGQELSIIVSREFETVEQMSRQVEEVNGMRKDFYGQNAEIRYLSELVLNSEYYAVEAEKIKGDMEKAIEARDGSLILLYGDRLVETMVQGHVVSRIYVHHIFYDILGAFYERYGIRSKARLFENVEKLLSCHDNSELMKTFHQVLNQVLTEVTEGQSQGIGDSRSMAERIKSIIEVEYGKDISLDEIAKRVNLAPAYVSYLFKKETGCNLVKYLTDFRMEKARKMLDESHLKIVQVGKACSYENQPYFNRLFKNYFGVTPKQYREQGKKEQESEPR